MADSDRDDDLGPAHMGVRPELDRYALGLLRTRVAGALFGKSEEITIGRYVLRAALGAGGGGSVFVAYDPDLAREVALKMIVAETPALRERALAEGQALARLSHPNVVPVFDVGLFEERVYLVMELIRGASLRAHVASARPRAVVAAYRQAAEGLAAAHAERLIHRDFKPDNALMGSDGRVRVIDFGLAIADRAPAAGGGTPRYMAPEQRRGEPLGPACDQFAFAASLREALATPRPWLERILARATSERPEDRFASMADLAAALARDPATVWRRRALVAVPLVIGVAGYALGLGRGPSAADCDGAREALAPAWTPARSEALAEHVDGLGTPYARIAAPKLRAAIDAYAGQWIGAHREGCLARQRGELAGEVHEQRLLCLDRARTQMATLIDVGVAVDAAHVEALVSAVPELHALDRCVAAAEPGTAPPPAIAPEIAAILARLDRATVLARAASPEAAARLADVVAEARTAGHRPLLVAALIAQGTAQLFQGRYTEAEAPLAEANAEALRGRDYTAAVEAFARLAWVRSRRADPAQREARGAVVQIVALADGLPPSARFAQALLHNNLGSIELTDGNTAAARAEFEQALTLAGEVTGPGATELTAALSNLAQVVPEPARRQELFDRRVAILRERLGDDHPLTLKARITAAIWNGDDAAALSGLRAACAELARLHPTMGATIAGCALELGWLELAHGTSEQARAGFALVPAAGSGAHHHREAAAYLALLDGKDARPQFQELASESRRQVADWSDRLDAARKDIGLAMAARAAGDGPLWRNSLDRAIADLTAAAAVQPSASVRRRLEWARRERERQEP